MARGLSAEAMARLGSLPDEQIMVLLAIVQAPRRHWGMVERAGLERADLGVPLIALMVAGVVARPWEAPEGHAWPGGSDWVTLTPYGAWLCGVKLVEPAEEAPCWCGEGDPGEPDCVRLPPWFLADSGGRARNVGLAFPERVKDHREAREVEYLEDEHTGEALVLMGVKVERSRRIKPPRRAG